LARFVQKSHAQNVPSPSGTDLKVKPMLARRSRAGRSLLHFSIAIRL